MNFKHFFLLLDKQEYKILINVFLFAAGYFKEMTMESRDINSFERQEKCLLPPWCIYIGYVLCLLLSVFAVIMVILYCFKFGYDESVKWVLACLLSLVLSVLVIEPLKVGNRSRKSYILQIFKN